MIYINKHEIVLDEQEKLLPWTSYGHVIKIAMDFIKSCPIDSRNQLPWYLQYSCFWIDPLRPTEWPDNPAGKFAWAVTTLLKYFPFSGENEFIDIIAKMLDRLWEFRTPDHFAWRSIPFASAHPGTGVYFGARADGEYVTEPDKIAQVGKAYLDFYKVTGKLKYFNYGKHCAETLSSSLRPGDETHSPLPFRVDVREGKIVEDYTAHMIAAVQLFDEMISFGEESFCHARDQVWNWICEFPLKNHLWKGYFEDIRLDHENNNRDQLSALETARYFLDHHEQYENWQKIVSEIIKWVKKTLAAAPFFSAIAIHEQKFCNYVMGSHTARFASVCAQYAELSGDKEVRDQAFRSFNWASYMANDDGTVTVGVDRPDYYNQCWFTDGYFDYVPHFIDGMAFLPETAPANENHLLYSTSVIQKISYQKKQVYYRCFDSKGSQRLRLSFNPKNVTADGNLLPQKEQKDDSTGWTLSKPEYVVDIEASAREVRING